eukprot:1160336-Pelagomonas_calceolata.AAC.11
MSPLTTEMSGRMRGSVASYLRQSTAPVPVMEGRTTGAEAHLPGCLPGWLSARISWVMTMMMVMMMMMLGQGHRGRHASARLPAACLAGYL